MGFRNKIAAPSKAEGIEFDLGVFDTDFNFEFEGRSYSTKMKIASAGIQNQSYHEALSRLRRPHLKKIRKDTLKVEQAMDIGARAMVGNVLKGWSNLEDSDPTFRAKYIEETGMPCVPYSESVAIEILKMCPELQGLILEIAEDPSNFQLQTEDEREDMGNGSQTLTPTS